VFDSVLDDEVFAFIAERREFLGQGIEPSVLRRLYTLVSLGIVVESARTVNKLAKLFAGMFRVSPFGFERIYETTTSNKYGRWRPVGRTLSTNNNNNTYRRGSSLRSRFPR